MATKKPELMTVPNLEGLAEVLGVHRRTLVDYAKQGCPTVKAKGGGYLIAPAFGGTPASRCGGKFSRF